MGKKTERSGTRVRGLQGPEMDFQLLRQLGSASYGGASVGECLALVRRMQEETPDQWVEQFDTLGKAQEEDALRREERGHRVSAREAFLRAANSYRAAEYYATVGGEPRAVLGQKTCRCFQKAMALSEHHCEAVEIPYGGKSLPGYFMTPHGGPGKKAIAIMSGFDGTCEETYFQAGLAGLERGYNVLLFAGPGQVDCLRRHPEMYFIPEYEKPVSAVLDWLASRPEAAPGKTALYGISFGGYFATRAAAHIKSGIDALIVNSPIVDLHAYMVGFMPYDPAEMPDEYDFEPGNEPEEVLQDKSYTQENRRNSIALSRRFGRASFKSVFVRLKEFKVGSVLENIACPCLSLVGEGEGGEPAAQALAFENKVKGQVTSHAFSAMQGADSHCQVGNLAISNAVVYDWLDEVFAGGV